MRRFQAAALAAIIVFSIPVSSAWALTLAKPTALPHEDVSPFAVVGTTVDSTTVGEAASGVLDPLAIAPPDPAVLAAEDAVTAPAVHAVDISSSEHSSQMVASTAGNGRNPIVFWRFADGDIVVVLDPWSTGHAGLFDRSTYWSMDSLSVISANVTPVRGVQRERCSRYRNYDRAYGLTVPSQFHHHVQARQFAQRQLGKPYFLSPIKTDTRSFYCSKLAWCAWYYTASVDLDGDGGLYVWPVDLVNSPLTALFGYWN